MSVERILVVDDEAYIVQLCTHILEEQGYRVEGTTSGMEALVMLETQAYDLLVVDVRMPNIDGLTILRHGKQLYPDLTAVVITGYASLDKAIEALQAGARGFVLKPFDFEQFLSAIEQALAQRRREQEYVLLQAQLPVLEISQTMMSGGDVGSLARQLLQVVAQRIETQRSALLLLAAEQDRLEVVATRGLAGETEALSVLPLEGLAAQVLDDGQAVVLDERDEAAQEALARFLIGDLEIAACALIPLHTQGQKVGLLALCRSGRMRAKITFSPAELRLLSVIGGQIALALENVRLYALEQERAEALAAALQQQRELTRLKNEFIQNVSHELRTPLALIHGYADLLASGEMGELQMEQQGAVEIIVHQTDNLRALVDDMITMLTNENVEPKRLPVHLDAVVEACLASFQVLADRKRVALQSELDAPLPPVLGDEHHLRVVVDHLVDNAIKFTPAGGQVLTRLGRDDGQVVLRVADTGIGIPVEHQEHIFDRFYQVDGSVRREYGGCGLGLALVKEIVEKHGGTVQVESQPGQGTTFTIRLPAAP
ncbi:MAG TPA: response regulator [Anaerolineae bacterium]|nr:response regulator [Anaerolineae bacterium]